MVGRVEKPDESPMSCLGGDRKCLQWVESGHWLSNLGRLETGGHLALKRTHQPDGLIGPFTKLQPEGA
jgi:hypothetical protein